MTEGKKTPTDALLCVQKKRHQMKTIMMKAMPPTGPYYQHVSNAEA